MSGRSLRRAIIVIAMLGAVAAGCSTRLPPTTAPASPSTTTNLASPVSPTASAEPCPWQPIDPAVPPPRLAEEAFTGDASEAIAQDMLNELAGAYADPAGVCNLFTSRGYASALDADWRLTAAVNGEQRFEQTHVLRLRSEGAYGMRPPTLPLEVIYDIPVGAVMTDLSSGESRASASVERSGLRMDLTFDGLTWRIDDLAMLEASELELYALPIVPPPGPPCIGFVRDGIEAPFDEDQERGWCDADGRGQTIALTQLRLTTRYPCNTGHAAILVIGQPLGATHDPVRHYEYVRDPAAEFLRQGWLTAPYEVVTEMPGDAAYTGWTNGNVELWISPLTVENAVYVVRGNDIERWPRAARQWGVIDCN